jgi:hypothetical protein
MFVLVNVHLMSNCGWNVGGGGGIREGAGNSGHICTWGQLLISNWLGVEEVI